MNHSAYFFLSCIKMIEKPSNLFAPDPKIHWNGFALDSCLRTTTTNWIVCFCTTKFAEASARTGNGAFHCAWIYFLNVLRIFGFQKFFCICSACVILVSRQPQLLLLSLSSKNNYFLFPAALLPISLTDITVTCLIEENI